MTTNIKKIISVILAIAMICALVTACGTNSSESDSNGNVTLSWYIPVSEPTNAESVMEKVNEYVNEKIGVSIDMKFIEPGTYDQQMNLLDSAGEAYDICWTSSWRNDFVKNVDNGCYIELDEYLNDYPDLKASMPETVWEASKVNGKLYGIFNYQILGTAPAFWFKKDIVEKYNLDIDSIENISDIKKIYDIVKEKEPDMVCAKYGDFDFQARIDERAEGKYLCQGFYVDKDTKEVGEYYMFSDLCKKCADEMRTWYENGYFPADISTASEADMKLEKAGKLFSCMTGYKPGVEAELKEQVGYDVVVKVLGKPSLIDKCYATMNAVSRTSEHPKEAMQLLALVNTDPVLYNMLIFGLEGQDYEKIGENRIKKTPDTYFVDAWIMGNQFNAYLQETQDETVWEETKEMNNEAESNPFASFTFDKSPVEAELAQIDAIDAEYRPILKKGLNDTAKTIEEMQYKMKQAGIDKVKAELQKQLNEWNG